MKQDLHEAFKDVKKFNLPRNLGKSILCRIEKEEARQARKWLTISLSLSAGSFAAVVFSIIKLGNSLINSDFWNVLSLSFSDFAVVAKHWNYFLPALLENLPGVSITAFSVSFFVLFVSLISCLICIKKRDAKYDTGSFLGGTSQLFSQ